MGGGGMSVQSMGEMGKDICPNFLQRFLDNVKFDFRGGIVLIFCVVNTCGCEFIDQKGTGLYG